MKFKGRLKEERANKGLTQEELGKFLNLSKAAISLYETGEREPDYDTLKIMSELFGCSTDYLLGLSDERRPAEKVIEEAISDDPELLEFFQELSQREDLQLMFKQTKDLTPDSIRRIIKYIKMVEDEESKE